jgi:glycosyltransferase involved in cell wall biosynthesis
MDISISFLVRGLGIAIIEAQASGLPCVVSDTIARDVNVANQVEFVPLAAGTDNWITALEAKAPIVDRRIAIDKIVSAGYDIDSMIVRIQDFYLGITSE